jgi:hypothetical protein
MGDERERDRDTRSDDEQALEEIRQLFARYRQIARHGMVSERDEIEETEEAECRDRQRWPRCRQGSLSWIANAVPCGPAKDDNGIVASATLWRRRESNPRPRSRERWRLRA